jgi:hypothetical protein
MAKHWQGYEKKDPFLNQAEIFIYAARLEP